MNLFVVGSIVVGTVLLFGFLRGSKASTEQVAEHLAAGALVVDVRTPGEFAGGHVKGALNVPVSDLERRLGELGAPGKVVVYCASGMRSARAAKFLKSKGFEVLDAGTASAFPK